MLWSGSDSPKDPESKAYQICFFGITMQQSGCERTLNNQYSLRQKFLVTSNGFQISTTHGTDVEAWGTVWLYCCSNVCHQTRSPHETGTQMKAGVRTVDDRKTNAVPYDNKMDSFIAQQMKHITIRSQSTWTNTDTSRDMWAKGTPTDE